jgi:DNA-binding MarR family transcriptional regulator
MHTVSIRLQSNEFGESGHDGGCLYQPTNWRTVMADQKSAAQLPDKPSMEDITELSATFSELMRTYHRAKQQFLARAKHNVEWSAQLLMSCVVNEGPLRSSTLAELLENDPSTVSRQVASLVKDGYLERMADPADGRASLLVATTRGRELHEEHMQVRHEQFRRMLAGWNEEDVQKFSALLRRFTEDFVTSKKAWLEDDGEPAQYATSGASQRES